MKYIFITLMTYACSLSAKSISETIDYPHFCELAAKDDSIFQSFKRQAVYQQVLEHVSFGQGKQYLTYITCHYPFLLESLNKFRLNDLIGNPYIYDFGDGIGSFSPSTLRYIKVTGDLISIFGDLSQMQIIEIVGGYGGQCTVLNGLSQFKTYCIIDLPGPALLTQKYLSALDIPNVTLLSSKDPLPENSYDLVISNYAFSEISKEEQQIYIKKILNRSKRGYLTYNCISSIFNINSLELSELIALLTLPNRKIEIRNETPSTNQDNFILVFYEKN